jgi:hypothetical protein
MSGLIQSGVRHLLGLAVGALVGAGVITEGQLPSDQIASVENVVSVIVVGSLLVGWSFVEKKFFKKD